MKPAEIIIIIIIISGSNAHIKRDKHADYDRRKKTDGINALTNRKIKRGLK